MININTLLKQHRKENTTSNPKHLQFIGVQDQDVYNITAPFLLGKQELLAGRIESRENEISEIGLFKNIAENQWQLISEAVRLNLQDPFVTTIDEEVILGGVEVFFEDTTTKWRTVFYKLLNVYKAEKLFEGPLGMKDLRLKQLADGKILVLTRPQGEKGGRGKIGVAVVDDLKQLSIEKIEQAPLLKHQFSDVEWGGANEIYLRDNRICVLGHIASFDSEGNRHYYAMTFELSDDLAAITKAQIIAERKDFLPGPSKRTDLVDVVFSGGLQFTTDSTVLYAGISDAEAQKIIIKNPF